LLDFFSEEFKLVPYEAVALMGAHTIGSMHPNDGSGYTVSWTVGVSDFCKMEMGYFLKVFSLK